MRPGAGCCCFSSPSSSGADVGPGGASQSQSTVLSQPRPAPKFPFTSSSLSNLCISSHFPTVHHIPINGFYHHLRQGSEAASKWHSKSSRGVDVSAISRFLGSIPPPPTRSPTILGPQVGDQQGTRISDRNLEAKAVVCVRVCDWRDGTEQGSTAEVAGAQSTSTRGGRPERAPGRGGLAAWRVPPLQDLSIEFSISTCPLSSSASLFPDPASIRARPCSAYPRVRR